MTTLIAFADLYPYLALCFFEVLVFIACMLFSTEHRRPMLLSALLFTPSALSAIILVPCYWKPKLFWDLMVGIEDVVFCFVNGGIVWFVSAYFMKDLLLLPGKFRPLMKRYIKYTFYGTITYSILFLMGFGFLWSTLGGLYILGFMLLFTMRRLWPLALCGTGTFFSALFRHPEAVVLFLATFYLAVESSNYFRFHFRYTCRRTGLGLWIRIHLASVHGPCV